MDTLTFSAHNLLPLWMLIVLHVAGCGGPHAEPTIDEFNGRITHKGEAVSFPSDEKVRLQLTYHKGGERFGIPITPEGTFDIGWMPIGQYSATLERTSGGGQRGGKRVHNIPGGLTIQEGQTEYMVELGEGFKS